MDIPGVQTAKFPAMACYGDSDDWLGGLLLAFDHSQAGDLPFFASRQYAGGSKYGQAYGPASERAAGPPLAATVALLAGLSKADKTEIKLKL